MNYYQDFECRLGIVTDSIKRLLFDRHPLIFERLDFDKDEIYLEPLLYTYIGQNDDKWLDCIIYGYETIKKEAILVFTNSRGVIYLPQIGYFKTGMSDREILLRTGKHGITLHYEEKVLAYNFEPLLYLHYGFQLIKHQHPLLISVFPVEQTEFKEIEVENVYRPHLDKINEAIELVNQCNNEHFTLLKKGHMQVMLYQATKPNCFAAMTAHNLIFLNVRNWNTEMFFVDHICHEGAHITFNTLTYESKYGLFKVPPNTNFSDVCGNPQQHSTLYLRFHGLFTYLEITKALELCVESKDLPRASIWEAKGRLVFHIYKFKLAIACFEGLDIFSQQGLIWYEYFINRADQLEKRHVEMKKIFNFEEQTYDFNSEIFKKENPIKLNNNYQPK